ncbi:MAG TPA: DNA double-strand break repair nuclease NurA, partial [Nitrolancea sp.]|nr:DNA double-strand break repair nuclease NurA [Nitrolancea sp.]
MTLDFTRLSSRLDDLAGVTEQRTAGASNDELSAAFEQVDAFDLAARIKTAKTSWLLAQPERSFQGATSALPTPDDYAVVASDGSFILPDRHSPARFYVINIGKVMLRYGESPFADITSDAEVYFRESELYVPDQIKRIPVNGTLLGFKRAAAELAAVADVAIKQDGPVIALQDGTLILWGLETYPQEVIDWILEPYLAAMETLRERDIPIASYISFPASTDVVNSVRVSVC